MCCFYLNYIQYSYYFSKIWSDVANLAWNLVPKWFSEHGVSYLIVITSFSMCYNENIFNCSLGTLVSSERQSDIVVRLTSSSCCFFILFFYCSNIVLTILFILLLYCFNIALKMASMSLIVVLMLYWVIKVEFKAVNLVDSV